MKGILEDTCASGKKTSFSARSMPGIPAACCPRRKKKRRRCITQISRTICISQTRHFCRGPWATRPCSHHHGTGQKDRCHRLRRREFIMKAKHTAGCTAMQPAVFFYSSVLSICFALSFGLTFPIAPTMTPLSSIRYKSAGGCFFYGRNTGLHLSRDQKHFSLRSFLHCSMCPHR